MELERPAVPALGLLGGELLQSALCSQARIVDRLGAVGAHDGCSPVAGELAEALAGIISAELLERLRDSLVKARAPRAPEILIECVLDEPMGE